MTYGNSSSSSKGSGGSSKGSRGSLQSVDISYGPKVRIKIEIGNLRQQ